MVSFSAMYIRLPLAAGFSVPASTSSTSSSPLPAPKVTCRTDRYSVIVSMERPLGSVGRVSLVTPHHGRDSQSMLIPVSDELEAWIMGSSL